MDHDEKELNEVVLPLLNVSRRLPDNTVNPKEPNQQLIFMSSASQKGTYCYDKLIDSLESCVIDPSTTFVMGMDWRVPVLHGLLSKTFINKLKMSPSYNEESFAREYASIFTGGSEDAWYSYDRLQRYRVIKNPELHSFTRRGTEILYFLSVDVGRLHDATVVTCFRVNITQNKFFITLVNIEILGKTADTKPFSIQARDLKRLITKYNPFNVVIDANGLGLGLCDEMIKQQIDDETGEILPAYGFMNNDDYEKIQPKDSIKILYSLKANMNLKSQINTNAYTYLMGGRVRFLIKEQEAKMSLLATEKGKKMSPERRIKRLLPHELTTKLFEEMANLRIKRSGDAVILEQINTRCPDDKYYSFAYGLWRIKEVEEEYYRKKMRRKGGKRKLTFYSGR